jgi:hypothetical protein
MANESNTEETGTPRAGLGEPTTVQPSTGQQPPGGEQPTQTVVQPTPPQDTEKSPAYGFWLAVLAVVLTSLVAFAAMLIFKGVFKNATDVTTVLSALFTIVGTVVGTYFGIKTSGDTRDKTQGAVERANETANRALAELSPEAGRRAVRGG